MMVHAEARTGVEHLRKRYWTSLSGLLHTQTLQRISASSRTGKFERQCVVINAIVLVTNKEFMNDLRLVSG